MNLPYGVLVGVFALTWAGFAVARSKLEAHRVPGREPGLGGNLGDLIVLFDSSCFNAEGRRLLLLVRALVALAFLIALSFVLPTMVYFARPR